MTAREVDLVIDRIVLHGPATAVDVARLRTAVEAELTRLITERGVPDALAAGARPWVRAPAVAFPRATDAATLGRQIAAGIYGGLGA